MSEIKVSQMPEANNINDNDLLMIIQGGYNKKIPKELLGIPTKAHQINVGEDTDYRVNLLKTKNLCDVDNMKILGGYNDSGYVASSNYVTLQFIKVKPNTTYTVKTNLDLTKYTALRIVDFNSNQTFIRRSSGIAYTTSNYTFISSNDAYYVALAFYTNGTASLADITQAQVEEGNTATDYEPFIPNQINVDNEKYSDTINVGAVEDNRSRVNVLHSENLINPQLATTTQNGITITNNGDGTYTVNGTASATVTFTLLNDLALTGEYKLTGCPAGGSTGTYYMFVRNSAWSKFVGDLGEGKTGTFDSTMKYLDIAISEGVVCNNLLFKPMITKDLSATYADYEPYVVPSIKVDNEEIYRKPKEIWSGNVYANNTEITLNEDLVIGGIYMIEYYALSGSYKGFDYFVCHSVANNVSLCQINYYSVPDNSGFRYRIIATGSNRVIKTITADNAGANTAITNIYRIA